MWGEESWHARGCSGCAGVVRIGLGLAVLGALAPGAGAGGTVAGATGRAGIHKIKHVVIIMQENRSFDSYFGTFAGALGFPRNAKGQITVCVPDPLRHTCVTPYYDPPTSTPEDPTWPSTPPPTSTAAP